VCALFFQACFPIFSVLYLSSCPVCFHCSLCSPIFSVLLSSCSLVLCFLSSLALSALPVFSVLLPSLLFLFSQFSCPLCSSCFLSSPALSALPVFSVLLPSLLFLFSQFSCPLCSSCFSVLLPSLLFLFLCSPLLSLSYNVVCLVLFIPVPFTLSSLSVLLRTSRSFICSETTFKIVARTFVFR